MIINAGQVIHTVIIIVKPIIQMIDIVRKIVENIPEGTTKSDLWWRWVGNKLEMTGKGKSASERRLCLKGEKLSIEEHRADWSSSQWMKASAGKPVLTIKNWLLSVVLKDEKFKLLHLREIESCDLLFYNFAETCRAFLVGTNSESLAIDKHGPIGVVSLCIILDFT